MCCIYIVVMTDFDFSSFVDVVVSPHGSRLRSSVSVGDEVIRSTRRSLPDFASEIVDLLVEDQVPGVRVLVPVADGLSAGLEQVGKARGLIEQGLVERASAVREVASVLSAAGFTYADISRVVGVSSTALGSFLRKDQVGPVWGSSALGDVPATVDGSFLVVGAWALGEDGFIVEAQSVLVSALGARVVQEFVEVTGLSPVVSVDGEDSVESESDVESEVSVDVDEAEVSEAVGADYFEDESSSEQL